MSTYFALLTITGTAKLANAAALGTQLSITEMAVGDGGGILPTPNTAQTALINERRRAALNMLSIDPANDSQIIAEQVIPESDGGFWIREIGLYDDEGDLIAIANCPETYKPRLQEGSGRVQTVRMILIVSSTDAVTLKIDPSVVLATRRYVDESVIVIQQKIENDGAKIIGLAQGGTVQDAILFLTPEMFGAIGDGVADDTIAIQTAIEYLKTSGAKRAIIGHGDYAISASLTITNFAYGFKMHLRSLRAHNTWPNYDNWKNAKPLISVGGNGGMVGLDIRCDYVNGGDKADWVNVVAQGCGGSHFHAERLTNVVNGYVPKNITWPSASNRITGGYWSDGTGIGIWLQKGSDGIKPIVEGHIIDVNFITGFKRGGTLLRDGAQYSDVRGLFDFNGRFLSEVAVTVNPEGVLVRGDTVTNGSNTAEVIAFYQQPVGSYKLLIAEGHDVSNDGSYFSSDDEITNSDSSWASAVNSVKTPDSAEWYPDIIHDFTGSAFGKCTIYASYCGGIVGGLLHSSVYHFANSNDAKTNGINGAQWVHSSSILSLRDAYKDNYVLDINDKYIAPYRHLYMRSYRIYGTEVFLTLLQSATTGVRTFSKIGDGTVTATKEVWRVTVSGALNGVSGECLIYVSASEVTLVDNTVTGVTLSVTNLTLYAVQGSQASMSVMFNFQRIL